MASQAKRVGPPFCKRMGKGKGGEGKGRERGSVISKEDREECLKNAFSAYALHSFL